MTSSKRSDITSQFGSIDIYVFDQIARGRITPGMRVLDAGCGGGRNLVYLLGQGADVSAVDTDPSHIENVRALAAEMSPDLPADQFRAEALTDLSFQENSFDVVLCSAVLHFLEDEAAFQRALDEMFRVLRPGGLFFSRLSSTIGVEHLVEHEEGRRYRLPGGQSWFLVDAEFLANETLRIGAEPADPLKTTVVQDQRSMTTWVLRKG
jgi:2-polyprenyl-3-methyl-5-hydroxy-6-metoxy-1,4-benzoquinol methylase